MPDHRIYLSFDISGLRDLEAAQRVAEDVHSELEQDLQLEHLHGTGLNIGGVRIERVALVKP